MDPTAGLAESLRFGRFELDRKARELRKDGVKVHLQDQPYRVLAMLLERPGDVVTREELRERLWPADTFVDFERGLNNAVGRLRSALGDSADVPRFVDTLPRVGYRFIAPIVARPAPAPSVGPESPAPAEVARGERTDLRRSTRLRRMFLAGGAVAAAAVTALLWALWRAREVDPPATRTLTHSGHDFGPAASPDGHLIAFASDRDGRRRIWMASLGTGEEWPLTSGPEDSDPRFSPDGSAILFTRGQGGVDSLYRVAVRGGEPRRLFGPAAAGDWSPDGGRLAYAAYSRGERPAYVLGVASADGADRREIGLIEASWMSPPRWSPDGRLVAVTYAHGMPDTTWSALVVDPVTGQQSRVGSPGSRALSTPLWARSGSELLFLQSEDAQGWRGSRLLNRTLASGRTKTLLRLDAGGPGLDRAGPGRIVFDARLVRQNLREHPLFSGIGAWPRWLTRGRAADGQPAYSSDGERVLFVSDRSGNLDLWEVSLASGRLRRLTDHPAEDVDPYVTHDGRILWSSRRTGSYEIWTAEGDGSQARQLTRGGLDARSPLMAWDGRRVVYTASQPAPGSLWTANHDGSDAAPMVPGWMELADVSADGERLLFAEKQSPRKTLRVLALSQRRLLPFKIELTWPGLPPARPGDVESVRGRARFTAYGRAVTFIDLDDAGRSRIFVQDFDPVRDTSATRRLLAATDPELVVESLALSPDGQRLTVAYREASQYLMTAEGLPAGGP